MAKSKCEGCIYWRKLHYKDNRRVCCYALDTHKVRAHDGKIETAEDCTHKVQEKIDASDK